MEHTSSYVKPTRVSPKNNGRKQLFQNPLLEKFTRTHIAVPIGIFAAFAMGLMYYGIAIKHLHFAFITILFSVGVLAFSLVEYLVHRYIFHMITDTQTKENIQYKFHGVHHEYPKDKDRLAMPPILSATIIWVLFGIFYLIMSDAAFGFTAGFAVGYGGYLGVHYMVHAFPPPKNIFRVLWVNHGIHHYKDDDVAFGVSSPLWDWVFGTLPKKG
ncbi:MAG: sterol desaturase family protein [Thermoflexibacter sp.]|jgi:sterol desaturase/sphingolipid hydroxylase (fatty acid hydroxylase superfamily)|nr:sterol desaturase family protein [Thermoflexibacter sp.]